MKSWKTTLGGALAALGQGLVVALPGDLQWIGHALSGIGALLLGVTARDNMVSTEQARAN